MSTYNREATERALVEAVGAVISDRGFGGLGVNAIARQAGVNKALIYRYFDGLDGLYRAFASTHALWPPIEELLGDLPERIVELSWRDAFVELFTRYARAIRSRPRTVELLAWECVTRNELTRAFEEVREQRSMELMEHMSLAGFDAPVDLRPAIAVASSSIHYLAIRSRDIQIFAGAPISQDSFWEHDLRGVLDAIARGL